MSLSARPAKVPFDPEALSFPPVLEALFGRPPATIPGLLLVAGTKARAGGWAAKAAIALAEAWADRDRRIVLADLDALAPELHEHLDETNGEGLADLFEFGASVSRIARVLPGRGFRFVPAGAYVPDPEGLLRDARWVRLLREFAEDQATLLAFAPAEAAGIEQLSRRIGKVAVLAAEDEAEEIAAAFDEFATVELVLVCEGVTEIVGGGVDRSAEADPVEAAALVPTAGVTPFDVTSGADDAESAREEEILSEPTFILRARPRRRGPSPVLWVAVALLVALGGWFAYRMYRGSAEPAAAAQEVGPAEKAAEPATPAEPAGVPLPYSVAIEAHQDYATAQERIVALTAAEPEITFYLAPIPYDSLVYHRVLAGPVADSAAAHALMQRLVDEGHKTAMDQWAIRPTTLAFEIGEFATREEAAARGQELLAQGIPTYIVEVPFTVGPSRFRLYAGAYESAAQAEVMAQLLRDAGLAPRLVERSGKPVA